MSKDTGSFLRKVVRFVANPTTDWSELDNRASDAGESDYAKTEIKAMIERKRRNDFVRKRELDMLRKIRREGLNPDAALALGSVSNLDSDSRPQSGARSDSTVKAKIDEIEQQMVGASPRAVTPSQAATLPTVPGGLVDVPVTAPNPLVSPPTLPFLDDTPQISQAVLDAARSQAPRMPGQPLSAPSQAGGVQVVEMAHDPELDEAVIAFANADFDQCEQSLLELIQPGAQRHQHPETWMVLFDYYRALDLPQKFDNLAVAFAQLFGLSAPQWYSLPRKVSQFLEAQSPPASGGRNTVPASLTQPGTLPGTLPDALSDATTTSPSMLDEAAANQPGWLTPAIMDPDAVSELRVTLLQLPRPWRLDWQHAVTVTPDGAHQLCALLQQWAREPSELIWVGVEHLLQVLEDLTPTGSRDADPAFWMLRLEVLRLINRPDQFDEVAIDYCVTFEQSPPSWESTRCTVRLQDEAVSAQGGPVSHVSEVTTTFVESQLHHDIEFVQVAALNLSGQLVGDIGQTLQQLDDQLGASISLEVDCRHLLRVDFIAAGDLLNWVLARRSEDRQVVFLNPHRLVALFFGAMGINEHATVKLQTV